MTIFIDIAGSWIVRASMITMMLGVSVTMNDALYKTTQQANANATLAVASETIYTDLNWAGYKVSGNAFALADSGDMQFQGDLNDGGLIETIRYYTTYRASTGLYELFRYVDSENGGVAASLGKNFNSVTFRYYNSLGVLTTNKLEVASVRIKLVAPIPDATSGFTTVLNDFVVHPANL